MKSLVVYYSLQGNTRLLAGAVAEISGADVIELIPENDISPKGFFKYLKGGKQALMKSRPALKPYSLDLSEYDIVFLGSPVWAFTYAPAFNTFFSDHEIRGKKTAFFCCHGGGKGAVFDKFRQELADKNNTFLGDFDYMEPIKKGREDALEKVKAWTKSMIEQAED